MSIPTSQPLPTPSLEETSRLLETINDPDWIAQASLFVSSNSSDLAQVSRALKRGWEATNGWTALSTAAEDDQQGSEEGREARLSARREIGRRRRLLDCWHALGGERPPQSDGFKEASEEVELDDDPWAEADDDDDEEGEEEPATSASHSTRPSPSALTPPPSLPFNLQTFLTTPIAQLALLLTTPPQCPRLLALVSYAKAELFPYRFAILEAIPDWISPFEFQQLLPTIDEISQTESEWAATLASPPPSSDGSSEPDLIRPSDPTLSASSTSSSAFLSEMTKSPPQYDLLSAEALSQWYTARIESIESVSGLVDVSLAYVQHAASRSIPNLDVLGEDLSLLSILVYDARLSGSAPSNPSYPSSIPPPASDDDWTLARFRSSHSQTLADAYLRHATPSTVVRLIKSVLFPYLFVLLSRSERTDKPDPSIPARHLQSWLLRAPLSLAAEVFAGSKATLPEHERLLKQDEEVARLALALLYGSREVDKWETMSRIFECLPAWEFGPNDTEDGEGATTLLALGQFLRPTPSSPPPPPSELFTFFLPLSSPSLSLLLDTLDVHLESAEVLARWGVPATLGWFILSAESREEQLSWATRMSKRGARVAENEGEDGWERLLRDMKKLRGAGSEVQGAFGMLEEVEIVRIYFQGLLGSGNFDLARRLLNSRPPPLERSIVEELVLAASIEFYENAESGNMHQGDMQLAYACLSVVSPPTPRITKELAFIEATSKIASYNLPSTSHSGGTLSPLEIRLYKDRLSLVSRILSQSEDAYKHPDVILDLTAKLGFEGDKGAEVKTLGMLADASVQAGDWQRGVRFVERMVEVVESLDGKGGGGGASGRKKRKIAAKHSKTESTSSLASNRSMSSSVGSTVPPSASTTSLGGSPPLLHTDEAIEVCWRTCLQFGRQAEFGDTDRKLQLIGHALVLCPPDMISDVLPSWSKAEEEDSSNRTHRRLAATSTPLPSSPAFGESTSSASASPALLSASWTTTTGERKRDIAARTLGQFSGQFSSSLSSFRPLAAAAAASASATRSASPAGSMFGRPASPAVSFVGSGEVTGTLSSGRTGEGGGGEGGDSRGRARDVSSLFGGHAPRPDEYGRAVLNRGVGWLLGASKEEMGGEII